MKDPITLTEEDIKTNNSKKFYNSYDDAEKDLEMQFHRCIPSLSHVISNFSCRGINCEDCPFYIKNTELFTKFISTLKYPSVEELKEQNLGIDFV